MLHPPARPSRPDAPMGTHTEDLMRGLRDRTAYRQIREYREFRGIYTQRPVVGSLDVCLRDGICSRDPE
jgi:hypothetical protein